MPDSGFVSSSEGGVTRRDSLRALLAGVAAFGIVTAAPLFSEDPAKKLYWLSCEGQILYPIYGMSGGMSSSIAAVLIDKPLADGSDLGRHGLHERHGGRWYVVEFTHDEDLDSVKTKINEAVRILNAW